MQTWIPPTGKDEAIIFTIASEKGHLNSILSNAYGIFENTNSNIVYLAMNNTYSTILDVDAKFVADQKLIPVLLPHYRFNLYYQISGKPRISYTIYASIRVLSTERLNLATPKIKITWYFDFKIYNPLSSVSDRILPSNILKNATVTDFTYSVMGRTLTQVTVNPTIKLESSNYETVGNGFTHSNDQLNSYVRTDSINPLTEGDQTPYTMGDDSLINYANQSRLSKLFAFFKRKGK